MRYYSKFTAYKKHATVENGKQISK